MEFQLTNPIELQPLEFNFEQLKTYLDERLEVYRGLIVSQDGIKAAKSDRAKLNKFKDALKSQRLEVKRTFMKPFDEFNAKVNELVVMVDKPINAIDEQIKRFKDADKAEKRRQIEEHFNSAIGELKDVFTLDKIYNPRWMNVTYKLKDIEDRVS